MVLKCGSESLSFPCWGLTTSVMDGPRTGYGGEEAPFLIGLLSHLFGAFS